MGFRLYCNEVRSAMARSARFQRSHIALVKLVTYSHTDCKQYSMGFSATPGIPSDKNSRFVLSPRDAPPQTVQFLTLYPTSFTVLDEMLAYSHYWTNQLVTCINQDVPTYFNAVQRRRLPIIASATGQRLIRHQFG